MGNNMSNIDINAKELNKNREILNKAIINTNSTYITNLHKTAKLLQNTIHSLDNLILKELPSLQAMVTVIKTKINFKSIDELNQAIDNAEEAEQKAIFEEAKKELINEYRVSINKFVENMGKTIKQMRKDRFALDDSTLLERINEEYAIKKAELDSHIRLLNEGIAPLLKAATEELSNYDKTFIPRIEVNPFKEAVDLLPDKKIVNDIDLAKPELSAVKVGYELVLTVLKGISEVYDLAKSMDKRNLLSQRKQELENYYQNEVVKTERLSSQIDEIKNLYIVDVVKLYYIACTNNIEMFLTSTFKSLNNDSLDINERMNLILSLDNYFKKLNLIWR